jgi:hypothetical protein
LNNLEYETLLLETPNPEGDKYNPSFRGLDH